MKDSKSAFINLAIPGRGYFIWPSSTSGMIPPFPVSAPNQGALWEGDRKRMNGAERALSGYREAPTRLWAPGMPGDRCGACRPLRTDRRRRGEGSGWPHCRALSTCKSLDISCPAKSGFCGRSWPLERKPRACQPSRGPGQGPRPSLRPQVPHWLTPQELSSAQPSQLVASCSL